MHLSKQNLKNTFVPFSSASHENKPKSSDCWTGSVIPLYCVSHCLFSHVTRDTLFFLDLYYYRDSVACDWIYFSLSGPIRKSLDTPDAAACGHTVLSSRRFRLTAESKKERERERKTRVMLGHSTAEHSIPLHLTPDSSHQEFPRPS